MQSFKKTSCDISQKGGKKEVSTKNAGMRQQTSKMPYQWVRKKSISKAIPIPLKVDIGGRALRARQRLYDEKVCARELGAGGWFTCPEITRSSLSRHMWLVSENERKKHKKKKEQPSNNGPRYSLLSRFTDGPNSNCPPRCVPPILLSYATKIENNWESCSIMILFSNFSAKLL